MQGRLQPRAPLAAFLATIQVALELLRLGRLQGAEQIGGEIVVPAIVFAHEIPSASRDLIFSSPSRIRPLTVPSGIPRTLAISEWLKPPK